MTSTEFATFTRQLFIQYPSLSEWLLRSSPDPDATTAMWHETLSRYSLGECMAVLAYWRKAGQTPFNAYERDQVAIIIRSVIATNRDRLRKREEAAERVEAKRYARRGATPFTALNVDATMLAVYSKLRPLHRQMLDGEITRAEYESVAKVEMARL